MSDLKYIRQTEMQKIASDSLSRQARRGWLFRILPATIILSLILFFAIQQLTGVPVYTILGADSDDKKDKDGDELEKYSGTKVILARAMIGILLCCIGYFLYNMYKDSSSAAAFTIGENFAPSIGTRDSIVQTNFEAANILGRSDRAQREQQPRQDPRAERFGFGQEQQMYAQEQQRFGQEQQRFGQEQQRRADGSIYDPRVVQHMRGE